MYLNRLTVALGALAVTTKAAQDPVITPAPAANLLERQFWTSSADHTSCIISSGLAVPQPSDAKCGLGAGAVPTPNSQHIKTYTDLTSTASPIACGQLCVKTLGCTQIFFASGSMCSLYSGASLFVKQSGTVTYQTYYDLACFECGQTTSSSSSSGFRTATSCTAEASATNGVAGASVGCTVIV